MSIEKAKSDLSKLTMEINRLDVMLSDARQRATKLRHYIEIAQAYEAESFVSSPAGRLGTPNKSALISSTVKSMLESERRFIRTRDLVGELMKKGIDVGGSNPVTNLSGFLSRSEDLYNDRTLGWGLAEWKDHPPSTSHSDSLGIHEMPMEDEETTAKDSSDDPFLTSRQPVHFTDDSSKS
ncbi:hypothetical protein GGE65_006208 [Skermanella aerolata]|uniref:hypothetical protein n=1 Tax=Skermanella aerolata TaxID=393310 RepID=UPI003D1FAE57